jgi:hypothetical protein
MLGSESRYYYVINYVKYNIYYDLKRSNLVASKGAAHWPALGCVDDSGSLYWPWHVARRQVMLDGVRNVLRGIIKSNRDGGSRKE